MNREETFREIQRLLLEQVIEDRKQIIIAGSKDNIDRLAKRLEEAGYGHINPAWGIPLYLQRN